MWELRSAHSQWRNPLRNLFLFVTALIVTVFGYLLISAPVASAQATWGGSDGSSIEYQNKVFNRNNDERVQDSLNVSQETEVYQFRATGSTEIEFIYFPDGNAATATTAKYVTYTLGRLGDLTNGSTVQNIDIDQRAADEQEAAAIEETSSCVVDGIGWIVCPITEFLATGMDWLFTALSEMLTVRQLELDGESPLFRAWKMMQGIANLAFIIAFLVIIYSQITSVGIQNYSIKRLLPRLIIAAILVNISYYICAIAIDLSNIAGYSMQDIFINMRNSIVGENGNGWQSVKWQDLAAFVLAGGTAAAAGSVALFLTVSSYGVVGSIIMLLPALLGVLLAVLVALLVLAARQAIITVLVILAPLAFVAYLLPNTEKWFDKWKDLFMTMLLLFPIFSVLFGGAQLAGTAIIQHSGGSINLIILGMVTQVAPIVITPLLIKFSGSLVGRIAGMVNNPNRGLIDRTRNWSKGEADRRKSQRTADTFKNPPKRRQLMRRTARGLEMRNRQREQDMALWKQQTDKGFEEAKLTNRVLQKVDVELKLESLATEKLKSESNRRIDELRAGNRDSISIQSPSFAIDAMRRAQEIDVDTRVVANQIREAQSTQVRNFTKDLAADEALRLRAGGIAGEEGAQSAFTNAVTAIRKEYNDNIQERAQLIKHFNLSSDERQILALGDGDVEKERDGRKFTFKATGPHADGYLVEAAIDNQLKTGSEGQIFEIVKESGAIKDASGKIIKQGKTYEYRTTISDAIPANGIPNKALIFGNKSIDLVSQGKFYGEESLNTAALYNLRAGKIKDETLAAQGADTLKYLYGLMGPSDPANPASPPIYKTLDSYRGLTTSEQADIDRKVTSNYRDLRESARRILEDPTIRSSATKAARDVFEQFKL